MTSQSTAQKQPPSSLVDRVEEILPALLARATETEQNRSVPAENIELLRSTGIFRSLVPSRYGGDQVDFVEYLHAQRRLGSACVSTAWVAGIFATHAHALAYFDKRVQEEVWADGPDALISSSFAAIVTGVRVPGGVRLTGTYSYASGVDHASWAILGFRIASVADPEVFESFLCLVPSSDYKIVDNWHTAGLRGTGSKQVVVDDIFVPEHRWGGPSMFLPSPDPALHPHWLYRIPFIYSTSNFVATLLGAADGAVNAYTEALKKHVRPHTGKPRMENPMGYVRLAEATLELQAATAMAEARWARIARHARGGTNETPDEALTHRGEEAFVGRLAVGAVDRLLAAAGGSATLSSHPIQRYWRDIHAAAGHITFDLENRLVIMGRHLVGLPPDHSLI